MIINFFKKYKYYLLFLFSGILTPLIIFCILYSTRIIHFSKNISNNKATTNFLVSYNNTLDNITTSTSTSTSTSPAILYPIPPLLPGLKIGEIEYPWKCVPKLMLPVRINQQLNAECMSFNGVSCLHTLNLNDCNLLIKANFTKLDPLECGYKHLEIYGNDGFSDKTHWCYLTIFHYTEY